MNNEKEKIFICELLEERCEYATKRTKILSHWLFGLNVAFIAAAVTLVHCGIKFHIVRPSIFLCFCSLVLYAFYKYLEYHRAVKAARIIQDSKNTSSDIIKKIRQMDRRLSTLMYFIHLIGWVLLVSAAIVLSIKFPFG